MSHSDIAEAEKMRSIAEVERETGLPRATVRIWERRYGFPSPARDDRGERRYDKEQVTQLAQMHQLIQQGHRPAKLIAAGPEAIRKLSAPKVAARRTAVNPAAASVLRLLKQNDALGLHAELISTLNTSGLVNFIADDLPQINSAVGNAWASGEVEVHQEHLYSNSIDEVMRDAIIGVGWSQPARAEAPKVLLTTVLQEHHALGLLMAQAMFAVQGCRVVSLGVRMPLDQIAAGARAHNADVVGLSFTAALRPAHVLRSLEELRGMLPPDVHLWAGGTNAALSRASLPGVRTVTDARLIPALLAEEFGLPPLH